VGYACLFFRIKSRNTARSAAGETCAKMRRHSPTRNQKRVMAADGETTQGIVSEPSAVPTRFPSLYWTTYEYVPLFQTHAGFVIEGITLIE
jgi:hypothetical protein